MEKKKKVHSKEKLRLHPRNKHRKRYDLKLLTETYPDLAPFVKPNIYGDESVDFFDPKAVKMLNTALLMHYYGMKKWTIPEGFLVPPVPGRADYIHHMADILSQKDYGKIPKGANVTCLDIGVGANAIYPIIGCAEYGWKFVGTEIDSLALASANQLIESNDLLQGKVELRLQTNPKDVFFGVIQKEERFDLSICNPPFYASENEAQKGSLRKLSNLNHEKVTKLSRNFGGQNHELWCDGGEEKFIKNLIRESKFYAKSVFWFSSLISKKSNLKNAYKALKKEEALEVKTIAMGQGNKSSRILVWTFLNESEQQEWIKNRW